MPPFQNARVVCILKWQMLNSRSVIGGLLGLFTGRKYYELWRVSKKTSFPPSPEDTISTSKVPVPAFV